MCLEFLLEYNTRTRTIRVIIGHYYHMLCLLLIGSNYSIVSLHVRHVGCVRSIFLSFCSYNLKVTFQKIISTHRVSYCEKMD